MEGSYDDGESLPDPDDGWRHKYRTAIRAIEDIGDPKLRKVLMILLVLAIGGKVGRDG